MTDEVAQEVEASQEFDLESDENEDQPAQDKEDEGIDLASSLEKEDVEDQTPEKYTLDYGEDIEVFQGIDEALQGIFREAKLTQEQAQVVASNLNKVDKIIAERVRSSQAEVHSSWKKQMAQHPMFVGDNFKKSEANIKTVFNGFFNSQEASEASKNAVRSLFYPSSEKNPDGGALINNPYLAEFIAFVGQKMKADTAISGRASSPQKELTNEEHSLAYARFLRSGLTDNTERKSGDRSTKQQETNNFRG